MPSPGDCTFPVLQHFLQSHTFYRAHIPVSHHPGSSPTQFCHSAAPLSFCFRLWRSPHCSPKGIPSSQSPAGVSLPAACPGPGCGTTAEGAAQELMGGPGTEGDRNSSQHTLNATCPACPLSRDTGTWDTGLPAPTSVPAPPASPSGHSRRLEKASGGAEETDKQMGPL